MEKTMSIIKMTRRGMSSVLLAATIFSTAGLAQDAVRTVQSGPRIGKLAVLQCCQCVGRDAPQPQGLNLSTGTGPWNVTLPGGAGSGTQNASNPAWGPALVTGATWISPTGNPSATGPYKYTTSFAARRCTIPSSITITGKFLADNKGTLYVDGVQVAVSLGTPDYGFLPGSLTPFSYTIPASSSGGVHTITMQADNSSGPTGIDVQLNIKRNCPKNVEVQGNDVIEDINNSPN
jgi:hypothetical protein